MSYSISASTEASAPAVILFPFSLIISSDNYTFDDLYSPFAIKRKAVPKKEGKGPEKRVIFFVWPYIAELTSYNGRRVWF